MATVTKKDLIDKIAERTGQKRVDVKKTVQELLNQIIDELKDGNRLEFRDFGVFETKERAPRVAQNPRTLERVPVPAKRTVKFKVGRLMRERVENATEPPAETADETPTETPNGTAAQADQSQTDVNTSDPIQSDSGVSQVEAKPDARSPARSDD
ncbi:MAG: HU family DNA-binding protein [Planctomycetota bacterium]